MKLKEILAISGHGGLFKFVSQGRNGIIVESFADQKRTFISAATKVSTLEDIAIFTETEEVPLRQVIKNIREKENDGKAIDHKSSNEELKQYMSEILPDYDRENVYVSDIKKIVQWYNILHEHNMLDFEEESEEPADSDSADDETKAADQKGEAVEKPVKTSSGKKPSAQGSKMTAKKTTTQKASTKAPAQKKTTPKKAIG